MECICIHQNHAFAINYAINRKGIADFGAARIGGTATKKASECCGLMQFRLKKVRWFHHT
jgi:hypothetical protein